MIDGDGWVVKRPDHDCDKPALTVGAGSLWRCPVCRKLWRVHGPKGGRFWLMADLWDQFVYSGHPQPKPSEGPS